MISAGCDLGVSTAKVVITENMTILASEIVPYKNFPHKAVKAAMECALREAGLSSDGIDACLATGFGGEAVHFAEQAAPGPTCLLRGIKELNPEVKTVIDVGGHTVMASNIDRNWKLSSQAFVEECFSGTGLFIEMMAKALEVPLEEMASGALSSDNPVRMTNTCVVLVESEVISCINEGYSRFDVFAGVAQAVASKIISLTRRVHLLPEVAMTGGVAKNAFITGKVEDHFGIKFADLGAVDPQTVAAYGAALLAAEGDVTWSKPERDVI